MSDYYERLNLSPDASQDEIRQAYQELVKKHHPDQSDADNAAQKFTEIHEAYEVLSDPDQREEYDAVGHDTFVGSRTVGQGSTDTDGAYERDRAQGSSHTTGSSNRTSGGASSSASSTGAETGTETADSGSTAQEVNWEQETRQHSAARHVWKAGSGPSADTAPPTKTATTGLVRRLIAYGLVIAVPFLCSVFLFGGLMMIPASDAPYSTTESAGLVGGSLIAFWAAAAVAEFLLQTDRRIWPFG